VKLCFYIFFVDVLFFFFDIEPYGLIIFTCYAVHDRLCFWRSY